MEQFKTWEELSRKEQLECMFWDAYKDAHGFRPRHINVRAMTEAELEEHLQALSNQIVEQEKAQQVEQQKMADKFELRVQMLIGMGAGNRETALRWIHEAENSGGDDEYLCFLLGLRYGYFKQAA